VFLPTVVEENEAEARLREAAEVARRQGARLWELRAVTSLARLLSGRGRVKEAEALLDELLVAFDDQPETPDVGAARRLRREMPKRESLRVVR